MPLAVRRHRNHPGVGMGTRCSFGMRYEGTSSLRLRGFNLNGASRTCKLKIFRSVMKSIATDRGNSGELESYATKVGHKAN